MAKKAIKKTESEQTKMRDSVRGAKFEVDTVIGAEWKTTLDRWWETAELCRRAANLYYETWLAWHVLNESSLKLEQWFALRKELGIKEAGKCPVDCMSKELSNQIYHKICKRYPRLQATVVTLLMNTLQKTLTSGKAAKGSLPKWSSILLHNERMPNFTKFFPIPFSKANAELAVDGDVYTVTMKTWRVPVEGKSTQVCIADAIKLRMTGRSAKRHLAEFHNIFTGEWRFMGSELEYDDNRRKWFVNLCYQAPSKIADVDSGKVAYLVCGRRIPFYVRTSDGKRYWLQGRGNHIIATRERVWKKRVELNYGSKKTTSMQSGHGRNAAMRWRARWAKTWTSFVKRVNHHVSKDAVDFCVANGIGRIVYCKPNGRYAERRMVSGDFKNSTWQFHDLGTKLAYKCQDRGVTLETKEFGSGDASGEVCTKTTGSLAKSKAKNATKFKRKPKSGNDS